MNTQRKGRIIANRAVKLLEDRGFWVEPSRMAVRWVPADMAPDHLRSQATPAGMVPINKRQDFFGIWDLIYRKGPSTGFAQITVPAQVAARRAKILASGFPVSSRDWILVYHGRPRARFRILRGPAFEYTDREEWLARR